MAFYNPEYNMQIVGRLGKDPEAKYTPNGDMVVSFSVATDLIKGKNPDGSWKTETKWTRCTAWREQAERLNKVLKKGTGVLVVGIPKANSWTDQQGVKRDAIDLEVVELKIVAWPKDENGSNNAGAYQGGADNTDGYYEENEPDLPRPSGSEQTIPF